MWSAKAGDPPKVTDAQMFAHSSIFFFLWWCVREWGESYSALQIFLHVVDVFLFLQF